MHRLAQLALIGAVLLVLAAGALAAAPSWLPEAANAKWILCGGEKPVAEEQGLHPQPGGGEGNWEAVERGGVAAARSVRENGAAGYFYLKADEWTAFKAWQGDADLLLVVRYWDGAPGRLAVSYDSSDPRVKHDPYPPGVWRRPDEYPNGLELKGTKTWQTATMRLQLAMFTKRVHGADFRLDPSCPDFALAGAAVVRVPKQAAQVVVTQNLRVDRAVGMESYGAGARFAGRFAQQADAPIAMEAELATSMALREGHTPGTDAQASGGAYIHYVAAASYKFTVQTPGHYIAWERTFFPWKGGWNHNEGVDDQPGLNIVDGMRTPEEGWQWIKAGAFDLKAGEHTFKLSYEGGARLDLIVLSRSEVPPDLAKLASSYAGATSGEVWTSAVRPFDVAQWKTATLAVAGQAPGAVYEYSTDGGQSWKAYDPQAGPGGITPQGGGQDSLQFHVKLQGAAGQTPPLFAGGAVEYLAGPHNVRYVENAALRVGMDPYGVQSIYDKTRKLWVSRAPEAHASLIMALVKPPGDAPTTTMDLYNASLEEFTTGGTVAEPTLSMRHRLPNGVELVSGLKLKADGQMEWQLSVDNRSSQEVCEVRFPVVTGVALSEQPEDDWIFVGKCWGQVWQNPGAGRLGMFWGPCMRWMGLWDEKQGLYLGIEDPKFEDWAFVYGGDASGGCTVAAHQRMLARPQGKWQSGVYRMAVTGGDWHQGADLYRAYVAKALKPCDLAPHIKWLLDEWSGPNSNVNPFVGWDVITTGGPYFWAANRQMTDGADSGYCGLYLFPALTWGSTREFAQRLAVRKAMGGMYTPYHNYRLWSPGYGHYPRIGTFPKSRLPKDAPRPDDAWWAQVATYAYTGGYDRLETDYFAQCGTAMPSAEWRDWLAYWTDQYLKWGTDGMYYDQYNMIYDNGRLYPGFDTYGAWAPAILEISARIKQASRKLNPYYTASGEFLCDVFGQYVDLHMTSGVMNRLDFFSYCNPRQILIDGAWNGGLADYFGGQGRKRFIWQCGARLENWTDEKMLALRRAVKSLQYDADFRDTVGVVCRDAAGQPVGAVQFMTGDNEAGPGQGVIGRWFLFKQGTQAGAVVNLINAPVKQGATCTIATKEFGPVTSAVAFTLEGQRVTLKGTQKGDAYTFAIPESECSSVVLSTGKLRPLVEWKLDQPATCAGIKRQVLLKIVNPNATPMSGTLTLKAPAAWKTTATGRFGPVAPGQAVEMALSFTVPASAPKGRNDLWVDVTAGGATFSAYSFLVVNEPVLVDFRGNPGSYHVWVKNLGAQPVTGTCAVSAPAPLRVSCAEGFTVPAEGEAQIPVEMEGRTGLREISEMQATVKVAGKSYEVVRGVMPVVPNADFETDSAGDMKPDWWMSRAVRDEWAYPRIHLTTEAHGGKYALLLDPPGPEEQFVRAYPTNGCWKPNTKYRVSVWIKATAKDGVYANVAGRVLGSGQTGPEWKQFTGDLTTGADPNSGGWVGVHMYNASPGAAWFDDLVVEEVQ